VRIPQFDLTRQYPAIEPEVEAALRRVLRSGRFILGAEGEAFERECAAVLQVEHAVAVSSGSDALRLCLLALGIGPGDEVVTPALSFIASATAVLQVGARPVFADVDPVTLTLAPDRAEAAITGRTRALIAVHLYGLPAAMDALRGVAEARGLALIEDAAQAFGAAWRGRPAGGLGTIAGFSFYPTKNLGACGDGGLVTTGDGELAARVRSLRNHGQARKYEHADAGWTSRLDELQAAILRVKLGHLGAWTAARQRVAARYAAGLTPLSPGSVVPPPDVPGARHAFHQYTIRTHRRDALAKHLSSAGIGSAIHYPSPIPAQPVFRALGYDAGGVPRAWAASREVLSLPCFPELTDGEVDAVIDAVRTFFEGEPSCES
jgi:dTDP-4-amino-4,6-dideoxygalactose transaminase